ncbi:MAG: hypothetical protein EI684_16280 [Candidatus Viridilinea halotolerans]|uniref:Glycosyltransferase RgtA/B/C/D-like domain-containing protein n=1 Tax=Candidatus Viridilinea halotolerans TaxID=2491704 RepID=A0A426TUW7_9CHLR|nr:MAG: hypothetical protein EI684_16280 [Candidatus Viridilinea halotolerans]
MAKPHRMKSPLMPNNPLRGWKLTLAGILLVAALLRLPFLANNPHGLYCDEACAGYDAYALLTTGADRASTFLPLYTRSFNVFPEAIYQYLTIPSIALFGLNEFAVRLPAAIIGILSVLALFCFVREREGRDTALVAALLLALSPWHVHFSRIGLWPIIFPLCIILALYIFFKSLSQPRLFWLTGALFLFSMLSYQAARLFVPLMLIGLGLLYWRELWAQRRVVLPVCLVALLALVPLVQFWLSPAGMVRASGLIAPEVGTTLKNYLAYFSPDFLFLRGDSNLRQHNGQMGQLYLFEALTLPLGLLILLRRLVAPAGADWRPAAVILLWLLLAPLAAALTAPDTALRALVATPALAFISALGMQSIVKSITRLRQHQRYRAALLNGALAALLALNVAWFAKVYLLDYPQLSSRAWQYGMRELIAYTEQSAYDCIVLSSLLLEPQIYVLFYTQVPAATYQQTWMPAQRLDRWAFGRYYAFYLTSSFQLNGTCLVALKPAEMSLLAASGYAYHEIHRISDAYGQEHIRLVEVTHWDDRSTTPLKLANYGVPRVQDRPFAYVGDDWYAEERHGTQRWRWMGRHGTIALVNPTFRPVPVRLNLYAQSYQQAQRVQLTLGTEAVGSWDLTPAGAGRSLQILLRPGETQLRLEAEPGFDGERALSLMLLGAELREVTSDITLAPTFYPGVVFPRLEVTE